MRTEVEDPRAPWLRRVVWAGLFVLAIALLGPLANFINTSSSWLDYPYPRPGSEGLILYESLLLKQGADIYGPITPERFISGPYPPVFYGIVARLLPDSLPDFSTPGHVDSIFRPGRLVALVSTAVAAAMLVLLVIFEGGYAQLGRRAILGAAAGGLAGGAILLTLPQVLVWATRFRGDMLMIALTAAGLVAIAAAEPAGKPSNGGLSVLLVLGAALFSLAFFTKQTALAGPIASALYLLARDWRLCLKWCVVMFLAVVVPFAALDLATGHWFYLKMVVYHSLPYSRTTLTRLLQYAFWDNEWPLIILSLGYTIFILAGLVRLWRSGETRRLPSLIPFFVLAAFLTLPTGGVIGADHNHLLMSGLAISASAGAMLAWFLSGEWGFRLALAIPAAAATLLLLLGYVLFTSTPSFWYAPDLAMPTAAQQEQLRKIAQYIKTTPGQPFFSDDPGMLAITGKQTPYDDPFTMTALANQGRWDESAYRTMLREGKFVRLVFDCDVPGTIQQQQAAANGQQIQATRPCRYDTFTPGALDAIAAGYNILFRDVLFTYSPK